MKTMLRGDWEFSKVVDADGMASESAPETGWVPVTIPHDWLIWQTENLYENSVGWYRRRIKLSKAKTTYLYCEGIYMEPQIFLNGTWIGEWKYGYQSFALDLTPYAVDGENDLLIRVNHQAPNSRWYSGAGIYRPVYLIEKEDQHFALDSFYIHSQAEDDHADLQVQYQCVLADRPGENQVVEGVILGPDGRLVCRQTVAAGRSLALTVDRVSLWSPTAPELYRFQARLWQGEKCLDSYECPIGFRQIRVEPEKGFFLNGQNLKLHGVCLHHDLGLLGAAYYPAAARRILEKLKKMGVNAIRTSHNMPAPNFLDLCDELGFLVVDEAFDMWNKSKTAFDYARFFPTWAERDTRQWIRRDRNHPCVIMWSIGNEIYDMHEGPAGLETMKWLLQLVREEDPYGNAIPTFGSNYMPWPNTQECADVVKVIGYNYAEKLYDDHHLSHPDWVIYGSETGSVVQSRGIYHFPLSQSLLADDDFQCSSLGNSTTSWGAKDLPSLLHKESQTPYSLGQFLWSGVDYIGEPTPYHTKSSYFGLIDTAGFPKDAYYIFQAGWTPVEENPMIHLYPFWDFQDGELIDLLVVSNCPYVELFFNGKSLGKKVLQQAKGEVLVSWQIPYEPGDLVAKGYSSEGDVLAEDRQASFGEAVKLQVAALPKHVSVGDLLFLEISALDAHNHPVQNARNRVRVQVGPGGQILGMDNGDSTDFEAYKTNHKRMFSGKVLAMIEVTEPGELLVELTSAGMESLQVSIQVEPGSLPIIPSLPPLNSPGFIDEIPLRQLRLSGPQNHEIVPEKADFIISCVPLPENTSYPDVSWRITDAKGIDSLIAEIHVDPLDPHRASVHVWADGDFTVRCLAKNGRKNCSFYATMSFHALDFGRLQLNPYRFISASLFNQQGGEIGNGNERGISTARDGRSWVLYENMNFGEFGTDQLLLPVFSFSETTHFRFWLGCPDLDSGRLILETDYTLEQSWNTYKDMIFHFPERIKGVQDFAIELESKAHIKGLQFIQLNKATCYLTGKDADQIYGDQFERKGDSIQNIGNNVTVIFENMEFASAGRYQLTVWGQTSLAVTSIHLLLEKNGETRREILEFHGNKNQMSVQLFLDAGSYKLSFLFLPGTQFDLQAFQFSVLS